jgi:hypothetical protein
MEADGSVQLHKFLRSDVAAAIGAAARRQDAAEGVGGGAIPDFKAGYSEGTGCICVCVCVCLSVHACSWFVWRACLPQRDNGC